MSDIVRTRVYAVVEGMELVDGDFMACEHVVDGRMNSREAYAARAKKLWPNFIPRTIHIMSQRVHMSEKDFYGNAVFDAPQPWEPGEHKRHAELEKNNE